MSEKSQNQDRPQCGASSGHRPARAGGVPQQCGPFEVGRTKSIAAIEAAMHNNSSVFLVAQREMDVEEPALRDLYGYGVIAEIKQVLRVSEDIVKVLVEGKTRARLLELDGEDKYLQATVRPVPVRGIAADKRTQVEALVRSLKDCFEEYLSSTVRRSPRMLSITLSRRIRRSTSASICLPICCSSMRTSRSF